MSRERTFGPGAIGVLDANNLLRHRAGLPRTALQVLQGSPRHLEAHLCRLQSGGQALGQPVPWLPEQRLEIDAWLRSETPATDAALRMVLDPGRGLLGAWLEPLPHPCHPCRLAALPHPMGGRRNDASLVHKGLSGPWGKKVLEAARNLGAQDALLLWSDGTLAETAIAAVGVEIGNLLLVPPQQGRVMSLAERLDLPVWAQARGLCVEQGDIPLARALQGQVWCLNALRGIWPAALL